jgi:hypothetical protein
MFRILFHKMNLQYVCTTTCTHKKLHSDFLTFYLEATVFFTMQVFRWLAKKCLKADSSESEARFFWVSHERSSGLCKRRAAECYRYTTVSSSREQMGKFMVLPKSPTLLPQLPPSRLIGEKVKSCPQKSVDWKVLIVNSYYFKHPVSSHLHGVPKKDLKVTRFIPDFNSSWY